MLLGLVGPLQLAHANTTKSLLTNSLNVAHTVPFLPQGQILVSTQRNVPAATPVLYLPGTITTNATSPQGAVVTYLINASDPDNLPYQITINCTPPSGNTFPIGSTNVLCTASDPAGNTSSGSFQVIVLNRTPPVLYLPGTIRVKATNRLGAVVTYTVSATDPNDPASRPIINCVPPSGSTFSIGTTTVLCTASDPAGNTSNGSFQVIVKGR